MILLAVPIFAAGLALPALEVPSDQPVALHDVLIDEVASETWLRFRFVTPEIARNTGTVTFAQAEADFEHLCAEVALPYLVEYDLEPEIVAVTLLDKPIEFGVSDPDTTQFIEVFRVTSGACIWEGL